MNQIKKLFSDVSVRCAAFLMAYYVTNSVFQNNMSIYYSETIGLNNTQIGTINALLALISVFSMQLWGRLGDRARVRNYLLCFMCIVAAALMALLGQGTAFVPILIMSCVFASFYTSIQPMGDSIVLSALAEKNRPFGPVRMAGGLSFAVFSMVFGYILTGFGDNRVIIWAIVFMCLVTAASSLYMPRAYRKQSEKAPAGMLSLFKNRELLRLVLFMAVLQLTYGYFYAFYSPLVIELGGSKSIVGWCYFISACSETPFLINSDKLFEKYGSGKLMCISAAVMTLRWFLLGTAASWQVAMASQLLHSFGFIVITVTTSKYVAATVPANMKASGQLMLAVFGFGLARAVGYLGGGVISDMTSRQTAFLICAAICVVCFAVFAPYYLRHKPLNGKDA